MVGLFFVSKAAEPSGLIICCADAWHTRAAGRGDGGATNLYRYYHLAVK